MYSAILILATASVAASAQVAIAWGQNFAQRLSNGEPQKSLRHYCENVASDIVTLSFVVDSPEFALDLQNQCSKTFPGSHMFHCPQVGKDITACQAMGKKVLLTLNAGETLTSRCQGIELATSLVETFGPKSQDSEVNRPFDDAVVDGINLVSTHGAPIAITALAKHIKAIAPSMILAASPSCLQFDRVFSDALRKIEFDYLFVGFHYDFCRIGNAEFNWGEWSDVAKASPNPQMKVFILLVGSDISPAFGYADASVIAQKMPIFEKDPSFGGFHVFEASLSEANNDYAGQLRKLLA